MTPTYVRRITTRFAAALALVATPFRVDAQAGALFLAEPLGARGVARGQAVSADSALGTEALWWNPAAFARLPKREVALDHASTLVANSDMLVLAVPSRVLGTLAAGVLLVNYGDQPNTDNAGNIVGTITNRSYVAAVSYASPIGKSVALGLTYKFVMSRFTCDGCVPAQVLSGTSSAIDLGAQVVLPVTVPIRLGATLRNVGPKFQLKDKDQEDPLPRIAQIGASSRIPIAALAETNASLDVTADVQFADVYGGSAQALSATLGYRDQYFLTGGYRHDGIGLGGFAAGLSLQRGNFFFDIAQRFDNATLDSDQAPLYVGLRFRF